MGKLEELLATTKLNDLLNKKQEEEKKIQAEIDLSEHLLAIRNAVSGKGNSDIKNIRSNRKKEEARKQIDFMEAVSNG